MEFNIKKVKVISTKLDFGFSAEYEYCFTKKAIKNQKKRIKPRL